MYPYFSTKVKRSTKATFKSFGYINYNSSKCLFKKRWLHLVFAFCLVSSLTFLTPFSALAVPQAAKEVNDSNYLLDRVIEWPDGTVEHIQINDSGFISLDGSTKHLVGMNICTDTPNGVPGQFYLPDNLAFLDKQLTYLQSMGVRLIRADVRYVRWWLPDIADEEVAWSSLLDLIYDHNMLLIAGIHSKWQPGFNDLTNPNFSWTLWNHWSQNCTPIFLYPEPGRNGDYCVGIEMNETGSFDPWPQAIWAQRIPVVAGKSYRISGWIKTDNIVGKSGAAIAAHWNGPGNTWISASEPMNRLQGTNDWTYYEGDVTAPPGATACNLVCDISACSGKAWFDDISFGEMSLSNNDSMGGLAERWTNTIKRYPNVIAVNIENELDCKLRSEELSWHINAEDQDYTAEGVADYLSFVMDIASKINVPITHNLMLNQWEPEIKRVCLDLTDISSFDCYEASPEELDSAINTYLPSFNVAGGWWCEELNYGIEQETSPGYWERIADTSNFNIDFIETAFNHNCAAAMLFTSYGAQNQDQSFFDENGNPLPKLVEIANKLPKLQKPIDKPQNGKRKPNNKKGTF